MPVKTKNRFEVSTEGMKALHEGRPRWQLFKELVSNAWDEDTTLCSVAINSTNTRGVIEIIVEDDGCGFADITDSWTLMKSTPKQSRADVRGRFNIGEKELLSIAREAMIETVGYTVKFPVEGGRKSRRNDREKGTVITATVNARLDEIEPTLDMLRTFIPPANIKYLLSSNYVDVAPVPQRVHLVTFEATLKTVLSAGLNEPLRNTTRKTTVDVYQKLGEQGGIYEMGIFIQSTEMPYDININQKVPLPPNRDVVSDAYLQDIYAEVLGRVKDKVEESDASSSWINIALEDDRTSEETVVAMLSKQLGDNAVLWSSDQAANEEAYLHGKDIVHGRTLSPSIREKYKDAGLQSSHDLYGKVGVNRIPYGTPTADMLMVEEYTKWIAKELLGVDCDVEFSKNYNVAELACYESATDTMDFNVGKLGKRWFENCPMQHQTEIIIHELGHANKGLRPHSGEYVDTLIKIGANAVHRTLENRWTTFSSYTKLSFR